MTPGFNGDYTNHAFGREYSVAEIVRRIAWEIEAEGLARRAGHNAVADAHALTWSEYTKLLQRIPRMP
jgi:hypothetical protein